MKKGLSILLALLMCVALVAGCGGTTTPSGNGTTPSQSTTTPDTSTPASSGNGEEVYNFTIAHAVAEDTSTHQCALMMKDLLEATGRFSVNIFPNAQLGGDREAIEGVQNGNITIYGSSSAPQVNFVQAAAIFDMPFVYKDLDQARKTLTDPNFFAVIQSEYGKSGFHHLGFSDQAFRTLTLSKMVQTPDDLKGVSIRTMENKYHMEVWRQLGANPTPLAFNELYTALQQNTVDGQENPIELIYAQKFYEQQKYVIGTNHILQTISWIMDKAVYDSLPADLQKVVDDVAAESVKFAIQYQDDNVQRYIDVMTDYGTEFIEIPAANLPLFADKAASTWEMIKTDVGDEVYDAFMAARG